MNKFLMIMMAMLFFISTTKAAISNNKGYFEFLEEGFAVCSLVYDHTAINKNFMRLAEVKYLKRESGASFKNVVDFENLWHLLSIKIQKEFINNMVMTGRPYSILAINMPGYQIILNNLIGNIKYIFASMSLENMPIPSKEMLQLKKFIIELANHIKHQNRILYFAVDLGNKLNYTSQEQSKIINLVQGVECNCREILNLLICLRSI